MTFLAEGDLAGARAVLKAAPKEVEPTALVAFMANYGDLVWVLDEAQRDLLLRLTPERVRRRQGRLGYLPRSGLRPRREMRQACDLCRGGEEGL